MDINTIAGRVSCYEKHDPRDCVFCKAADTIEKLKTALGWLASEVERDHELGRLSVDSEDCAKAARELLSKKD